MDCFALTVDEAKATLAAAKDLYDRFCVEHFDGAAAVATQGQRDADKLNAEAKRLERAWKTLGQEMAAVRALRVEMRPWMLDVVGSVSDQDPRMIHVTNLTSYLQRAGGSLRAAVLQCAAMYGYTGEPEERGGGFGGWHVGWQCKDEAVHLLSTSIRQRLMRAIESDLLSIRVQFWGWRF